jgi:hypothetical protein
MTDKYIELMTDFGWVKSKIESQKFSDCKYLEYHLMHSDLLDDDNYPTDKALEIVEHWPMFQNKTLFEFIQGLWYMRESGWHEEKIEYGTRYSISTLGWSGNESIIAAMQENSMLWDFVWYSSRVGGHYVFRLKEHHE